MTQYAKTNHSGLLRDMSTNVIINTNDADYNRILEQRKQNRQSQAIQQQIDNLKNEFVELKELLKQVINGSK